LIKEAVMNKPVLGIVVGGVLGLLDGLAAPLQVPEVMPEVMGIVIGSTFKGVVVGLIAGFFARKVRSVPLGIAVGLLFGMGFAWLIASQPDGVTGKHYYWEIMLPGSLAGAIVGWVTQRYGTSAAAAAAALLLCLSATAVRAESAAADPKAAFDRLKTLVGDWDGHVTSPEGPAARVEFRLAGNGSALVERLFPGTAHEMVSIYHMAGSDLVLTHYCAMANQPRMKLVAGGSSGDLAFDFTGGDNVDPSTSVHMHSGRFSVTSTESYEADWEVFGQGKPSGHNRFFMKRVAKSQ
jgi:hypothetical protein